MIFYKNTFYFISILLLPTAVLQNNRLRIIKSGLAPASACKIGLEFFAELNNTSGEDFHVELIPDECCLKSDDGEDCDSLQIIGECSEDIPKETIKTLKLVAPLIEPYEREGYCTIHVDSRPSDRKRDIMRDTLNIHFNTKVKENVTEDVTHCLNIDEDPLNDCKPVNCDTYYNGKKSYFDKHIKRCVEVTNCVDKNLNKDINNQIYDPKTNKCIDEEYVDINDINYIKSLSEKDRYPKDILLINTIHKPTAPLNLTDILDDSYIHLDIINNTKAKIKKVKDKVCCLTAVKYLLTNKYTLLVLGLVVTAQCLLIVTMVYCLTDRCFCNKKKVVSRFFNYRQDASVTTPLIGTSNMDTETTEFDYVSETSNVEKKIKCYKACQKQGQENIKMSMSDDILSKCLNRRDWNAKPKSETIDQNIEIDKNNNKEDKVSEDINEETPKETCKDERKDIRSVSIASEKEIKCHNYNIQQSKLNFKATEPSTNLLKGTSVTTDKGAQACFSNDSIDDFLSERGMLFLGENASKYSFTSSSTQDKSSLTELTSKTSKNNIIKNVLSYLSKSKIGTSSDPGVKKTKSKSKNLELIHISHASVYSSSSELNNVKCVKLVKDSRSTF